MNPAMARQFLQLYLPMPANMALCPEITAHNDGELGVTDAQAHCHINC
jgi:hypothetical protein